MQNVKPWDSDDTAIVFCLNPDTFGVIDSCISADETQAAERIVSASRRRAFLVGRTFVRLAASRTLGCAPREVPIVIAPGGQPLVEGGGISFSISHTVGLSVVALGKRGRIGVDVERRDLKIDRAATVEEFFNSRRKSEFFHAWTRNEAVVKATGQGLVFPAEPSPDSSGLRLKMVDIGPAYTLAVAADAPFRRTRVVFLSSNDL